MAEIPQERDFITWSIEQFVTKYHVSWLIDLAN